MNPKMKQITNEYNGGTEWFDPLYEFDNPEALIGYLQSDAPAGSYKVEGTSIWATDEAIEAAVEALEKDLAKWDRDNQATLDLADLINEENPNW